MMESGCGLEDQRKGWDFWNTGVMSLMILMKQQQQGRMYVRPVQLGTPGTKPDNLAEKYPLWCKKDRLGSEQIDVNW
jgi:hypothetical protein